MRQMMENDNRIAQRLSNQRGMINTKNDVGIARRLQRQFSPNIRNDEIIAKNLQRQIVGLILKMMI